MTNQPRHQHEQDQVEDAEQGQDREQAQDQGQVSEVSGMTGGAEDASVSDGDSVHGHPTQESGAPDTGPAGPNANPHPGARKT